MKRAEKIIFLITFLLFVIVSGGFVFSSFFTIPFPIKKDFKLGLDLQGGIHLIYEPDLSNIKPDEVDIMLEGLKNVMERRVNFLGVREPVIQLQGQKLIIELSGISNPETAIKEIGKTPFLEFREERDAGYMPTGLTGRYLKSAQLGFDEFSRPIVLVEFNAEGSKIFETITERNVGKTLGVFLDGNLISNPVVREKISSGKAQIIGNFTLQEAKELVENLNVGALPVPINLVSYNIVGPSLGKIYWGKSYWAGVLSFLTISLFLVLFYKVFGILMVFSLIFYLTTALTLFKLIPVTLTLSGIAGFLLSLGMAVDGGILVTSRIKEELKEEMNFSFIVQKGLQRAWPAIRDGNLTTILIAIILFLFGTSFVRGFATTLIIGVLLSLFSTMVIFRYFLYLLVGIPIKRIQKLC